MEKIKIGIPKALTYYYLNHFWHLFFKQLDVDIIYSPDSNKKILERGQELANDEMCLSLKMFLGHVDYLKDKCDYLLIPRIEDYGNRNQTCTNFLSLYDLVHNLVDVPILNYNISSNDDELLSFIEMGETLGLNRKDVIKAYYKAKEQETLENNERQKSNNEKMLTSSKNILVIAHPYNTYDNAIGQPIIKMLKKYDLNIVYCDQIDKEQAKQEAMLISPNLYWKYSKENIGSIKLVPNLKGVLFLSAFPCGLDSLVNEYLIRKIDTPYLNIIIDDLDSLTGMETRIESFIDIVTQN